MDARPDLDEGRGIDRLKTRFDPVLSRCVSMASVSRRFLLFERIRVVREYVCSEISLSFLLAVGIALMRIGWRHSLDEDFPVPT